MMVTLKFLREIATAVLAHRRQQRPDPEPQKVLFYRLKVDVDQEHLGFDSAWLDTADPALAKMIIAARVTGFVTKMAQSTISVILEADEERLQEIIMEILAQVLPFYKEVLIVFVARAESV